jgi:hypothetical protein
VKAIMAKDAKTRRMEAEAEAKADQARFFKRLADAMRDDAAPAPAPAVALAPPAAAVSKHPAFKEALHALSGVEDKHQLAPPERVLLRKQLLDDAESMSSRPALPSRAPELWNRRRGNQETPDKFIRRVYRRWLGQGLKRSHLLTLDKPLYTALGVWLHRHPDGFPEFDE